MYELRKLRVKVCLILCFKQKTGYGLSGCLVGSEMCIRVGPYTITNDEGEIFQFEIPYPNYDKYFDS